MATRAIQTRYFATGITRMLFILVAGLTWVSTAEQLSASRILSATGVDAGFCVLIGDDARGLGADIAMTGKFLVHHLAPGTKSCGAQRERGLVRGIYGLLSSQVYAGSSELPYLENTANLLIVDNAEGAGLNVTEVARVLAPSGFAHITFGGTDAASAQSKFLGDALVPAQIQIVSQDADKLVLRKSAAVGVDTWTHFDRGPECDAYTRDTQIGVPGAKKWGTDDASSKTKNGSMRAGNNCFVYATQEGTGTSAKTTVHCRDAYNGQAKWTRLLVGQMPVAEDAFNFVIDGDRLYTIPSRSGPVEAWSLADGKTVKQYPVPAWSTPVSSGTNGLYEAEIIFCDGKLIHTLRNKLYVLDPASGVILWQWDAGSGKHAKWVSASADANMLFVVQSSTPGMMNRWPLVERADAVVGLNLDNGNLVWRCSAVKDWSIGQLAYSAGYLGVFCSAAIIGGGEKEENGVVYGKYLDNYMIGSIDAKSGKLLWSYKPLRKYNVFAYSMFVSDGKLRYNGQASVFTCDLRAGFESRWKYCGSLCNSDASGDNQRCARGFVTSTHTYYGFGTWVEHNTGKWVYKPLRRGGCATRPTPAYGLLYYSPAGCRCLNNFDGGKGFVAFSKTSANFNAPGDRNTRDQSYGTTVSVSVTNVLRKAATPVTMPESPIVADWPENQNPTGMGKAAATTFRHGSSSIRLFPSILQTEITAGDGTTSLLISTGRIRMEPLFYNGIALLGGRDGIVYGVRLSDGKHLWSFRAAPAERRILVASQVESSWPVSRMLLEGGILKVTAGTDPNIDGGLYHYGINPDDGTMSWSKREQGSIVGTDENVPRKGNFGEFDDGRITGPTMEYVAGPVSGPGRAVLDARGRTVAKVLPGRSLDQNTLSRMETGLYFINDGSKTRKMMLLKR